MTIPTTRRNKMIEQDFNYPNYTIKEMTDLFEIKVENLEARKDKKKSSTVSKEKKDRISTKKRKRADSNSSVVESC